MEHDGQPSADATGDGADEDGVMLVDPLVAGATANLQIKSSTGGGSLDYFVDLDHTGGFGNMQVKCLPRS